MLEKLFAKRHIANLELNSVRDNVIEKLGWPPAKAEDVELQYRRFLYALTQKHKNEIISPPSKEVDDFWHQHILDTAKYREDCEKLFGHYLDHIPSLTADQQAQADQRRRRVYADHNIDSADFTPGGSGDSGGWSGDGGDSHQAHGHHGASGHAGHGGDVDTPGTAATRGVMVAAETAGVAGTAGVAAMAEEDAEVVPVVEAEEVAEAVSLVPARIPAAFTAPGPMFPRRSLHSAARR